MLLEFWSRDFRNLEEQPVFPGPGLNLFAGANGAGKTSILEACHVLGRGRSFRTHRLARVCREGTSTFLVGAEVDVPNEGRSRAGVEWSGERRSRLNGQWLDAHWEVARRLPVLSIHSGSFELLTGIPEERRRLLDWCSFFLDVEFPKVWKIWRRAHEQHNAALKMGDRRLIERFEDIAAEAGAALGRIRERCVMVLAERLKGSTVSEICSDLEGEVEIEYRQGWPAHEELGETYRRNRAKDLERGFTQSGPQKGDLDIRVGGRAGRDVSRGEQKRVVTALVIAQGLLLGRVSGRVTPLLLVDDLLAEMDSTGVGGVMNVVAGLGWQTLATTVDLGWARSEFESRAGARLFHVEHGKVRKVG